jgi:hypothetical protein
MDQMDDFVTPTANPNPSWIRRYWWVILLIVLAVVGGIVAAVVLLVTRKKRHVYDLIVHGTKLFCDEPISAVFNSSKAMSTHKIKWELSTDNQNTWTEITAVNNVGLNTITFNAPATPSPNCFLRATDVSDPNDILVSNRFAVVSSMEIKLGSPGSERNTHVDPNSVVTTQLVTNEAWLDTATWSLRLKTDVADWGSPVVVNLSTDKTFQWTTPTVGNEVQFEIKAVQKDQPTIFHSIQSYFMYLVPFAIRTVTVQTLDGTPSTAFVPGEKVQIVVDTNVPWTDHTTVVLTYTAKDSSNITIGTTTTPKYDWTIPVDIPQFVVHAQLTGSNMIDSTPLTVDTNIHLRSLVLNGPLTPGSSAAVILTWIGVGTPNNVRFTVTSDQHPTPSVLTVTAGQNTPNSTTYNFNIPSETLTHFVITASTSSSALLVATEPSTIADAFVVETVTLAKDVPYVPNEVFTVVVKFKGIWNSGAVQWSIDNNETLPNPIPYDTPTDDTITFEMKLTQVGTATLSATVGSVVQRVTVSVIAVDNFTPTAVAPADHNPQTGVAEFIPFLVTFKGVNTYEKVEDLPAMVWSTGKLARIPITDLQFATGQTESPLTFGIRSTYFINDRTHSLTNINGILKFGTLDSNRIAITLTYTLLPEYPIHGSMILFPPKVVVEDLAIGVAPVYLLTIPYVPASMITNIRVQLDNVLATRSHFSPTTNGEANRVWFYHDADTFPMDNNVHLLSISGLDAGGTDRLTFIPTDGSATMPVTDKVPAGKQYKMYGIPAEQSIYDKALKETFTLVNRPKNNEVATGFPSNMCDGNELAAGVHLSFATDNNGFLNFEKVKIYVDNSSVFFYDNGQVSFKHVPNVGPLILQQHSVDDAYPELTAQGFTGYRFVSDTGLILTTKPYIVNTVCPTFYSEDNGSGVDLCLLPASMHGTVWTFGGATPPKLTNEKFKTSIDSSSP